MKKNIYLTAITIITIICIIAGTCYHVIGWGVQFLSEHPFISHMAGDDDTEAASMNQTTETLDSFDNMELDISVSDLTVTTGDSYSISYDTNRASLIPKYKVNQGTLTVTQKSTHNGFWGNTRCTVRITVPESTVLNNLTADGSVGDVLFKDIQAQKSTLDFSVGDIDLENSALGDCSIDTSTGDIDVRDCTFDNMEIDTSVGDVSVSVSQDLASYDMTLDTGVGEVTVNGGSHKDHYESKGDSSNTFTIDNSTGDISVNYGK